jgi:CPA1 family monovalent cation:H+ antiporter
MNKFWSFFAFLVNSLIFLSLGLLLSKININIFDFLGPILLTILVIIIARAISVYIPINFINFFKKDDKVPLSRQHLLAWGSLR